MERQLSLTGVSVALSRVSGGLGIRRQLKAHRSHTRAGGEPVGLCAGEVVRPGGDSGAECGSGGRCVARLVIQKLRLPRHW